jgi:acyl dehydratase
MSAEHPPIGYTTEPYEHKIDWHKASTYALGIGATRDELDYVYEARGPKVYPTYGVIPAFAPMVDLVGRVGGSFANLVHGSQSILVHNPIPPEGLLRTTGRLEGIYDLKRMAQIVVSTRTEMDGVPLVDTTWMIILFDMGNFGGPRPPKAEKVELPDGRAPDFVSREATRPEQALLYRLSGDTNPLHIDADFAKKLGFEPPILHGLCTFGFVARAVINGLCEGKAERLRRLSAHFKKPVWPGDTLLTSGWKSEGESKVALDVKVEGRDDSVLGNAWAEIAPQ